MSIRRLLGPVFFFVWWEIVGCWRLLEVVGGRLLFDYFGKKRRNKNERGVSGGVACIPQLKRKRGRRRFFFSQAPRDDVRARHLSAQRADTTWLKKRKKGPRQRRKDNKSPPPLLLLIVKRLKRPKQNRETCKENQPMRWKETSRGVDQWVRPFFKKNFLFPGKLTRFTVKVKKTKKRRLLDCFPPPLSLI